ncbi:hypothetical protein J6595_01070 [Jiella sp. KSK16Y-1]|uniref:DUF4435 domain-containing protein n=2 Tax=Jiella mangrovi TaxID=2821407 RepID=A0ABS4BDY7_9HYPH|nr:hypothetical protein [Jiella mangrovi]
MLPYIIENLIYSGATEVIITDSWRYSNEYYDEISKLPKSAKNYVKIVDISRRTALISNDIFESIFDDLGIEFERSAYRMKREAISREEEVARNSAMVAHSQLPNFLEALFLKCHFHFDMFGLQQDLENVRRQIKDPEGRIRIAGIQGILSTYRPFDLAAATLIAEASKAQSDRLLEIILSSEFKALSADTLMLGGLTNIQHVVSQINFRTRKLLNSASAKGFLSYTQKAATAASGVPIPTTELADSLLKEAFLPPVVDMSEIINKAKKDFVMSNPDFKSEDYFGSW